ncbi:MAG: hypothetical protein LBF70_00490 [Holosporales bacterium]|jgi:hypothetical protein|nr:hypothetical protein [Holosporales bacterium]
MLLPNKITPFNESILAKFPILLKEIKTGDISAMELFKKVKPEIYSIADYLEALDCLFTLKKIELTEQTEILHYVD